MSAEERHFYRRCSTCKQAIDFEADFYRCSVSTCNRKRLTLVFCGVPCWEAHQADARHRDAWAEADRSPSRAEWERERERETERGRARETRVQPVVAKEVRGRQAHDVLVVAAKLKQYIRDRTGMSTSDRVFALLSDHLRRLAERGCDVASRDGRKTLMQRDLEPLFAQERRSLVTGDSVPDDDPQDMLVVVSKFKAYVKASCGMNTSDGAMPILSDHLRHLCREAIRAAGRAGRRTVMPQDFTSGGADT